MILQKIKELWRSWRAKSRNAITVYAIFDEQPTILPDGTLKDKDLAPLTFVGNLKDAASAVDRLLYIKHFSHFKAWAFYSNNSQEPTLSEKTEWWAKYKATVLPTFAPNEFSVLRLTYKADEIAAVLRIFSKCAPLYLGYESTDELITYVQHHSAATGTVQLPDDIMNVVRTDESFAASVTSAYELVNSRLVDFAQSTSQK